MKNIKNIYKYFAIIFGFIMGLFLFNSVTTQAYVFYYNGNSAVGVKYDTNGYITDVKDEVIIYGQDARAGYTVAYSNSKQIRVKNVTVKVGDSNAVNIGSSYYSVTNIGKDTTLANGYSITNTGNRSNTDQFTIKLQSVLNDYFSSYSSQNGITITITLEKKGACFFTCAWDDYTSITYKDSSGSSKSQASLNKTNQSFFESQLGTRTSGSFTAPDTNKVDGTHYYNRGATKSSYYYTVKTGFKVASGSAKVNYTNKDGTSAQSTSVSLTSYSTYAQAKITNTKFSGMFANDVYNKYTFYSFYITAKDLYGISASKTVDNTDASLTVATILPKIDEVQLSSDVSESYGAMQVNTKFDMDSMDYTNNSYTYTLTSVTFNVGSSSVTKTCSGCTGSILSSTKSLQKVFTIYSNEGTGAITFKNAVITVKDKYNNSKSYTAATQITSSVSGTITLKSNADGAEFSSTYTHYYDGDTISFSITLKGLKNTTVANISLVDDNDNEYVIYNSTITKDVDGLKKIDLVGVTINYDDEIAWTGIKLNDICNGGTCEDSIIKAGIYFNQYKTLTTDATVTNDSSFKISGMQATGVSVTSSKIAITNSGNSNIRLSGACNYVTGDEPYVNCGYSNSGTDGSASVSIEAGAIVLSTGQRSAAMSFKIVENRAFPSITVEALSGEEMYHDSTNKAYYYKGTKSITVKLNDGYCGSGKFKYKFEGTDYEFIDFSCGTNNILVDSQIIIPLPGEDGTYTFQYFVISDGVTQTAQTHQDKYIARNELSLSSTVININGDAFLNTKADDYFNKIAIGIDSVDANSLLNKYRIQFSEDLSYTESMITIGNNSFLYDESSRNDLVDINGEPISFKITLFDRLGNSKEYSYTVNVDTLTPTNPDPRASTSGTNYIVTISNYASYTEGDVITIAYDTDKELTCTKGVDATCSFTITDEVYSLKATDRAGNESAVTRYTTVETNAAVMGEYLQIYPFLSDVYDVRDDVTIRVVTYNYTTGSVTNPSTIIRMCTSVTTTECYTTYYLTSSSMYELLGSELNVKISSLKLKTNATYMFLVSLGNSSQYLVDTEGNYPRKNVEYADVTGPTLVVNSISSNPRVVSDSPTSSNTFTFNFELNDANFASDSKFEYLIINKANVNDYNISNTKFSEYLNYCPRNWSSYLNVCGQWSTELNSYASINGDTARGIITISKNGTMLNNTTYILFVRAYDNSGNYSIVTLNEIVNISDSVNVYYKDGDEGAKTLAIDNMIKTINPNANLIIEKRSGLTEAIEISSIKLNGTTISPNYRVGEGIHTLVVTDTLGNVENITIYCGALSKPTITIFNYYDGEYYEISSDSAYAYNSSTLEYLYVKVSGTNIQDISVNDGTDRLYDSDDVVFGYLTNADSLHEHGMKLADLITNANGRVTIRATGDGGEVSSIELNVDNQVPVIQIISGLGSSSVYLFDTAHSITLETGTRNYTLEEANYKYELNYEYLFNRLNLIVDNKSFDSIKTISNLIVKLDGVRIEDYTTPVATKASGGIISIEYFDDAGNIAEPLYIKVTIVDKEAPKTANLAESRVVEANQTSLIFDEAISISDNFNSPEDIIVKAYIDGIMLYDEKYSQFKTRTYTFTNIKRYVLTFTLSDTNGNVSSTFTQNIESIDTTSPAINGTLQVGGMTLGNVSVINLPSFIDTDKDSTVYYPTIVEFYLGDDLVDSDNYTHSFDTNTLTVRFKDEATLGNYTILLKTMDASGNVTITTANFVLTDTTAPVINVYVNGVLVTGDTAMLVFGDTNYSINFEAIDAHDGKLSVSQSGDKLNVNKQGEYIYTLKAKDKSGVQAVRTFKIIVEADDKAPVINKVTLGKTTLMPSNESLVLYTSVNYRVEYIKVDATDNARVDTISIDFDGTVISDNTQVRLIDGKAYTIIVVVKDSSGNTATSTYYLSVDNSGPAMNGVENYRVYDHALNLAITDSNLLQVSLYKDNTLVETYEVTNAVDKSYTRELTAVGQYRIVALDTFKNESVYVFEIKESLTATVMGSDGNASPFTTDATYLTKVSVGDAESIVINVTRNENIGKKDQVYVIVADPNSNNVYVAYTTNGGYFNNQSNIVINGSVITGVANSSTLETIGESYYAYVMVIKSDEPDTDEDNGTAKTGMSESLKSALGFLGFLVIAAGIIILAVKIRRKVRAV